MNNKCPDCKNEYDSVSIHIGSSSCEHPKIDTETMQSIKGVLLGDGTLKGGKNKYVRVAVKQKRYIEHLKNLWRDNCNKISQRNDGLWRIATVSHHQLNKLQNWYNDEKTIPSNLQLTPMIARH